ncbi:hypothetical protein PoB_004088300 [Plakobranchus ocellatus]|uniref:Uncharacterized protein n=1 Tax=Plakobranchus ocellatus TaxID=259542 RepID=A0AAV4B487_9GAST|nr:hypothetical protein PoB_004088300 [Plakobranchus ocellatus]
MLQHLPQLLLFESNFFPGAYWMEERQIEEKGTGNSQKQAKHLEGSKHLHMIGTNEADRKTAHPGCALQTFDCKGARQSKLDLTWLKVLQKCHRKLHQYCCHFRISDDAFSKLYNRALLQNYSLMLTSDSNVEDKALVVHTDLHKDYRSVIKGLRRKRTILYQG